MRCAGLLQGVVDARKDHDKYTPIFLKIAPDLTDEELAEVAGVAQEVKVDAVIATNTTLSREGLKSAHKDEAGAFLARLCSKNPHVSWRVCRN